MFKKKKNTLILEQKNHSSFPVLLEKKKDGIYRIAVDLTKLNAKAEDNSYKFFADSTHSICCIIGCKLLIFLGSRI